MTTENHGVGKPEESAGGPAEPGTGPSGSPPAGAPPQGAHPQAGPPPAPHPPVPPAQPPARSPAVPSPAVPSPVAQPPAPPRAAAPPAVPPAPHAYAPTAPVSAPGGHDQGAPPPAEPWAAFPPPPPPKKRRSPLLVGVVVATIVAGGIGGGVGYLVADDDGSGSSTVSRETDGDTAARPPESVAGIAEAALPSVVTIEAGTEMEGSSGTGFVYDEEGHIMTNNHVVASAADGGTLTATFSDGASYDAEVVGRAEGYDVAVLRLTGLEGRELEPLPMGDSDQVAVGDGTIAIGAPFGLSGTVTTGIISAKDRPVASSDGQSANASYMNALQTDASINPGNSGGPLLNADGSVIGVNSAIRGTPGGSGEVGSIGLGFAIPINQATAVAADLIETGEPVYPIIGASVESPTGEVEGARIVSEGAEAVTPNGPADQAGLEPGDVITQFGDTLIDSSPTLISQIWTYQPGDSVEVTYVRDGQEQTTTVVLGERVGDQ
ncbi:PDZ domain-containing protein [Streptomyces radicis]|uniref:PDZ domain-containing protein n=1 Tax=Streptomyces radicis TaxID=1750517 RepID=A0A3A9W1U7_9ACTN|nr:PDZ domain-containing protein [Streptomyces radicis]RKN26761.1 PDZ domain-containing protein [Streptomyces radicis]